MFFRAVKGTPRFVLDNNLSALEVGCWQSPTAGHCVTPAKFLDATLRRSKSVNADQVFRVVRLSTLTALRMTDQNFTLNTGAKIPALGLGTWQSDPGQVKDAVAHALKHGYRHVDAAFVYGNENEVGEGLKEAFASGVKREDVFITSKVWNTYHRKPEECLDEGLKRLGLDYVDLYLIHWPVPTSTPSRYAKIGEIADMVTRRSQRQPSSVSQTSRRLSRP